MIARRESDPVAYLLDCSDSMLQDIALARRDKAAAMRKLLRDLLDELVDELLDAELCAFVMEHRSRIGRPHGVQIGFDFCRSQVTPRMGGAPAPKKSVDAIAQRRRADVA